MNFWQEILARPRDVYAKLSRGQRMGVLALVSLGIVFAALSALLGGRTHFAYLYGNLDLDDANAIVAKLTEAGIPYELSPDGTMVQVPDTRVTEARMKLAEAQLPKLGSAGFELFDGNQLGLTTELFEMTKQRALQGKLEETLASFDGVQSATVILFLKEQAVYAKGKTRSTASVFLKVRPGARLDDLQTAAMAHLVAGVGHGMDPEDVSIVDSRGDQLFPRADSKDPMNSLASLQKAQAIERQLEEKSESQIAAAFGPGKAQVRVSVELDPKYTEKASEKVAEDNKVPLRTSKTTEPAPANGRAPSNVVTDEQSEFREGVDRTLEINAAGTVKRMSVSVLVDKSLVEAGADGAAAPTSAADLEALVKQTVGFVEPAKGGSGRADSFKLVAVPFVKPPAPEAALGPFAIENLLPLAGNLAEAVTVVIVLLTLTRVLRGGGKPKPKPKGATAGPASAIAGVAGPSSAAGDPDNGTPVDELQELVMGESRGIDVRTRLARFVQHYPDQAREVLVAWLKEEVVA